MEYEEFLSLIKKKPELLKEPNFKNKDEGRAYFHYLFEKYSDDEMKKYELIHTNEAYKGMWAGVNGSNQFKNQKTKWIKLFLNSNLFNKNIPKVLQKDSLIHEFSHFVSMVHHDHRLNDEQKKIAAETNYHHHIFAIVYERIAKNELNHKVSYDRHENFKDYEFWNSKIEAMNVFHHRKTISFGFHRNFLWKKGDKKNYTLYENEFVKHLKKEFKKSDEWLDEIKKEPNYFLHEYRDLTADEAKKLTHFRKNRIYSFLRIKHETKLRALVIKNHELDWKVENKKRYISFLNHHIKKLNSFFGEDFQKDFETRNKKWLAYRDKFNINEGTADKTGKNLEEKKKTLF